MKLPRPRHSTVVAYLALFTALGGTSYAAIKLPANSVGSRELKPRSVQTSDLALNARVSKSNKVFRSAVTDVVLDPNTQAVVDALKGAVKGEKGDTGPAGPAGATGTAGPAGVSGYVIRDAYSQTLAQGQTGGLAAKCAPDESAIGGGGRFEGGQGGVMLSSAPSLRPDGTAEGWGTTFVNQDVTVGRVHSYAVCAKIS